MRMELCMCFDEFEENLKNILNETNTEKIQEK